MIDLFIKFFLTEFPACELMSFGFQPLNLVSTFAFFVVAYHLYMRGGKLKFISLFVALAGIGSFAHHLWPVHQTVPFDVTAAVVVAFIVFAYSYKELRRTDWLLMLGIGTGAIVAFVLDEDLCLMIPSGLHFVWHVGAALVLYIAGQRIPPG